MNKQLNQWTENMWRHGAIDVGQRDDLKWRLNDGEDFATIVKDLEQYVRYMPAGYQKRWPQVRKDAGFQASEYIKDLERENKRLKDIVERILDTGEWVWSESDDAMIYSIYLPESSLREFEASVGMDLH